MIYLDLEADGLEPTQVWCVVTRENGVNLVHTTPETLSEALTGSVSVVGHNLIGYDIPVLERLWGLQLAPERIIDTLVLCLTASLLSPLNWSIRCSIQYSSSNATDGLWTRRCPVNYVQHLRRG